jgi:hypothetical protein
MMQTLTLVCTNTPASSFVCSKRKGDAFPTNLRRYASGLRCFNQVPQAAAQPKCAPSSLHWSKLIVFVGVLTELSPVMDFRSAAAFSHTPEGDTRVGSEAMGDSLKLIAIGKKGERILIWPRALRIMTTSSCNDLRSPSRRTGSTGAHPHGAGVRP